MEGAGMRSTVLVHGAGSGPGVFANGARAQSPAAVEQHQVHDRNQQQRQVRDQRIGKEHVSQHRDLRQQGYFDRTKLALAGSVGIIKVRREPEGQSDDHGAADDLVHLVANAQQRVNGTHQPADDQC